MTTKALYSTLESFIPRPHCLIFEKKLLHSSPDEASFSRKASEILGRPVMLEHTLLLEICGNVIDLDAEHVLDNPFVLNKAKETLIERHHFPEKYGIVYAQNSQTETLKSSLRKQFHEAVTVQILDCWNFGDLEEEEVETLINAPLFDLQEDDQIFRL